MTANFETTVKKLFNKVKMTNYLLSTLNHEILIAFDCDIALNYFRTFEEYQSFCKDTFCENLADILVTGEFFVNNDIKSNVFQTCVWFTNDFGQLCQTDVKYKLMLALKEAK